MSTFVKFRLLVDFPALCCKAGEEMEMELSGDSFVMLHHAEATGKLVIIEEKDVTFKRRENYANQE